MIITYSRIGYNTPSQANWSYGIFQVAVIDEKEKYNMSWTVKENFGGDSRFRDQLSEKGHKVIEIKPVFPTQKITGIRSMQDMESAEFVNEVDNFIKTQTAYHLKYNHN